ncbi:hypothetical protein TRAPUB_7635 [Trametes pubescens]|uniref:Uncharacterized protein n=1 Tax=Trametes pubescens TaxID=154538 RepID=A0A1M2W6R6_TRAPU|nr:hypothetical protein TRAPUB_7635 [Trametes pubescens]
MAFIQQITPEFHQGNRTPRKNSPSKGGAPPTEWTFNWYDSLSGEALSEPPDFVPKGPIGRLCIGDIYYHRTPYGCQLWLRVADSYDEPPYWLPVSCGYERADGKFLILTRVHKLPSWVVESTYRQWKTAMKKDMERADGKEEQDA